MKRKKLFILSGVLLSAAWAYQQQPAKKTRPKQSNSDYRQAMKTLWTKVYPRGGETLYCGERFSTKNKKKRRQHVNAEHVFPMAWVTRDLRCGTRKQCQRNSTHFEVIESDLHNIYPTKIALNKARSHYRFGNIPGEKRQFGNCDFEVDHRKRLAEPRPAVRGDIARAMLYMAYQYDLTLHRKTEKLMREWDKQDPPSKKEIRRAQVIEREQGRENPFITRYPYQG